jgi:DNA-binding winged helix-turn-helix (wHTH) protein
MLYSIGLFILDTDKEMLLLASTKEIVSSHSRVSQLLSILAEAYPKTVSKNELTQKLWPDNDVTEWALSRQISQVRQILSSIDSNTAYIKTVHTKGFKLEVEPSVIENLDAKIKISPVSQNHNSLNDNLPEIIQKKKFTHQWTILIFALCLLLGITAYSRLQPDPLVYGEIYPKKTIVFPLDLDATWGSSEPDTARSTVDGIVIEPIGSDPLFVKTSLNQPEFYQGAVFSIKMKVNQGFVDNDGWVRPYYQSTLDGWPGEWDCNPPREVIDTMNFKYDCIIDENDTFVKILENEPVIFGIKIHEQEVGGNATIQSAQLNIPAGISTDKGWHTTNNVPLTYNRGVSYSPKSLADQLLTFIKGPINIAGSKVAFTISIDDSLIDPIFVLQLFIITKDGKWQDCFASGIQSNVFTTVCDFSNIKDPFVIGKNERVEVGIRPAGKVNRGQIKIIGVTITE